MRKLPAAVLISTLGHAAAMAWVTRDGVAHAVPPPLAVPAPPPSEPPPPEPLAVVLLDEPVAAAPTPRGELRAATSTPRGPAPARSEPAPTASTSAATGTATDTDKGPPRGRSPLLRMRDPDAPPAIALSPEFLEHFLSESKPLAPAPDIPGERIDNEIAEVKAQMRAHPEMVDALRHQLVDLYNARDAEELKSAGGGTYKADKETFTARVERDGTTHLTDKPGQLDTQDRMMLSRGIDPYGRNKLAFLDRTRDQRVAVGERWRRQQLGRSAQLMQQNIDRLWATTRDLSARKAGLFELWDDCAESGSEELIAAGVAARTLVIGTIRMRLHGADAYTAAELVRFNSRRRSKAVFEPYEHDSPPAE